MSGRGRLVGGALLTAAAMVPLVGSLDLLAERRVLTSVLGLAAGGLLLAAGARLLLAGSRPQRSETERAEGER